MNETTCETPWSNNSVHAFPSGKVGSQFPVVKSSPSGGLGVSESGRSSAGVGGTGRFRMSREFAKELLSKFSSLPTFKRQLGGRGNFSTGWGGEGLQPCLLVSGSNLPGV